jgi:hypothetical protein
MEKLRLVCVPTKQHHEALCFLCDDCFEPGDTASILTVDDIPMGCLCPNCAGSRFVAASKVRRRAKKILALANFKVDEDSAELELRRLQLIHRRAAFWESFATRVEQSDAWK